jgi:membrane protease subunit HflK
MVDVEGGNNLLYLPLDKIMESRTNNPDSSNTTMNQDLKRGTMNSLSEKIRNNRDSFNSRKRDLYSE